MKKFLNFINTYKKWLFLLPCLAVALLGWVHRAELWGFVPMKEDFILYNFCKNLFYIIYLLFSGLILAGVIQIINAPPLIRWRFKQTMQRQYAKSSNSVQNLPLPVLTSIRPDRQTPHGKIYTIKANGFSTADFEVQKARLGAISDGKIYRISYGRRSKKVLIYCLPRKYDIPTTITINSNKLCQEPNFLVVGQTGTGKSYALTVLLGIYAHFIPNVSIWVCDYKKSSFLQFAKTPNFYGYEDVPDGIRAFYQEFLERLEASDEERNKQTRVLLIDEYGALISAQDKKTADELKTMVGNMLFMGRSLGIRVLVGVQRADAEYFKAGARDQFRAILALGNISKEQKQMLFSDYKDSMDECNGVGEGYLLIDGQEIERVKVAEIADEAGLNECIRKAMCR